MMKTQYSQCWLQMALFVVSRVGQSQSIRGGKQSVSKGKGAEHLRDSENKRNKSVLYKHILSEHNGQEVKFQMEITGRFKDAISRQANEAVRIYSRPGGELLKSKLEFNHPPMARVVLEKHHKTWPNRNQNPNFQGVMLLL